MADNRNFDSVFADCTKDELEFDAIFDEEDDLLVDLVAGVDEAGIPLTGEDFDFSTLYEADDMVGEKPDFDYQKDGDAAYGLKDAEGSKYAKLAIGGEVGDGKEVSGKEDSAMSNAYEVTKKIDDAIGANDKQQLSLEADVLDLLREEEEDQYSNDDKSPIADDDPAYRAGTKDQSTGEDESIEEGAKFTFLPKIEKDPELKSLVSAAEEAEDILNSEGEDVSNADINRIGRCALRICDVLWNVGSYITLPLCVTVVGIPFHLIQRAYVYAARAGQYALAESYTRKCIVKMKKLANNEEDPKKKEVYEKNIEKMQKALEDSRMSESASIDYLLSVLEDSDEVAGDDIDDVNGAPDGSVDDCGALCKEAGEEDLCPDCGKNPCECAKNEGCECDPLTDLPDEEARAGATCAKATDAPEVEKVIESMLDLLNEEDITIEDQDDEKMRDGSAERDDKNIEGVDTDDLGASLESTLLDLLNEEDDPLTDQDDVDMRDGSAKRPTDDVEGVGAEVIGAAIDGDSSKDPIEDTCDCGERQGAIKHSTSDVEGVGTKVVGAALESDNVDDLLAAVEDDDDVDIDAIIDVDDVVGDEVQQDGSNNAEIKTNEAASNIDDIVTDIDDDDIKEVEDNTGSDAEIEYSEDDDDLINAVMNGLDID